MFENLSNNSTSQQPANPSSVNSQADNQPVPPQAEDIFAAAETQAKPAVLRPINAQQPNETFAMETGTDWKKYLVLGSILLGIIIVGGLIYFGVSILSVWDAPAVQERTSEFPDEKSIVQPKDNNEQKNNIPAEQKVVSDAKSNAPIDSDQDGLTDEEERQAGTNPNKVDTEGDGLFDHEEVKIYQTDPRSADTDKDGISDGDEIKQGLNPNGQGRLFNLVDPNSEKIDSDLDGLTDNDENKLYLTNINKADTGMDSRIFKK